MESGNFENSLKQALVGLKHYVDLQVKYQKLILTKRLSELSSMFALFLLLLGVSGFILLFLSFSFVEWYTSFGERLHGFLLVSLFYIVIGLVLIVFRQQLIFSPLRKMFGNIFLGDDADPITSASYKTKESLELQIANYKDILENEEDDLKEKFQKAGKTFTIVNVVQGMAKSVYKTFVTTSNIARMTYSLVNKLRGGSKKKRRKKDKGKSQELEESDD